MGESHKEWIEHRKVFRSLDAIDREENDRKQQNTGSENNRRYETYSRALPHRYPPSRETPRSSERENTSTTPPGWLSFEKKRSIDHNQGSRFKEEHQNDRGYKATTGEYMRDKSSETCSSTSSGGNQDGSGQSDTHGEKKGNGSYGYQGPAYFESDSDSDSDSSSDSDSDPEDGKDEDDYDNDDYDDDSNYDDYGDEGDFDDDDY
ncbi:hypothetical protein FHL15_003013 [Xylaria flabelliformis]|uniref:Uncharacterized protein n=1 Tax=Xylaria flabelliformis TaxID=2512241 RepID=A0A553I7V4_9PEZI|nr:hypothetical protein FHL15_003013 [Xylaria flabelliformis]